MNYGFVIDNRSCIGCHACSTACKAENEVPLGVYRTWVKYVEKGSFPNSRRSFQVTRCNHCANPPCVRICPVTAMYQREDGIVEFDPEVCIGCKACMQACPYDAIYIDPDTGTAAKCHYCSHRTEIGLEPACVVVCPTQAIISGDLDDPQSPISTLVARHNVSVRKPEQGTMPKLYYIEGDDSSLTPTASLAPEAFVWADVVSEQGISRHGGGGNGTRTQGDASSGGRSRSSQKLATAKSGTPIRRPGDQGMAGQFGPIQYGGGTPAEHMVQTAYNAQHKVPWHWQVPAYLVTKGIGAGAFVVMALLLLLNPEHFVPQIWIMGNALTLLFIGITTALLVADLERPERFLSILTRPQWRSWLTRGAFVLVGLTLSSGLWLLVALATALGWMDRSGAARIVLPVMLIGAVLAILAAVYTAFLFGQAEGRDLWQSPMLPLHMFVQSMLLGSGWFVLGFDVLDFASERLGFDMLSTQGLWQAAMTYGVQLINLAVAMFFVNLILTLIAEFGMPASGDIAGRAAHAVAAGKYRRHFWLGAIGIGHLVPIAIAFFATQQPVQAGSEYWLSRIGMVFAITIGIYFYEHAFVMAPQEVPNS